MTVDRAVAVAYLADHPDEAARILERAQPEDAAALLGDMEPEAAARVFRILAPSPATACAAAMPDETLAAIIDALDLDDAGVAMRGVATARHAAILERLDERLRDRLRAVLAWGEHTAGALADPLVLAVADDLTVADAQRQLRGSGQHLLVYVYVVRRDGRLTGVMAIRELMAARPRSTLSSVMTEHPIHLEATTDVAAVATHPAWRDFDALPVTDANGRLVGAIRHKTIRRMGAVRGRPLVETIVGLSEAYWVGLSGMLASLSPRPAEPAPREA